MPATPPALPFVLNVGITGHRAGALAEHAPDRLRERVRDALQLAAQGAERVRALRPDAFGPGSTRLRLISPIADGADQIAAEVALNLGWELQVLMPFDIDQYRASLADDEGRRRFDALARKASTVMELPGGGPDDEQGYVMVGRATVAHADLIVAVWDGRPPRGRGGTADVVQQALVNGTAIMHLPPDPVVAPQLLWSAFDPAVRTTGEAPDVSRPLDLDHLQTALAGILLPPNRSDEISFLEMFQRERIRRFRTRVEYPLLLAILGVRRFGSGDVRESVAEERVRDEWRQHVRHCADAHQLSAGSALLEDAYSQSDRLATHFAQTYRSGHIFSFVLGGVAVCIGLSTFLAPHLTLQFAAAELLVTLSVIVNAWVGTRNEWHRRWLDYRQLAERLRPMRSLKLLAIAAPDPPGSETEPVPRRWIDFYAGAIWRAIGCPSGRMDEACAKSLARAIADHEVAPQVAYHRKNARQIETLDRRLDRVGMVMFLATLLVSVATMVGIAIHANFLNEFGNWFSLVSSGFPALGTAIFGIRFQGDFGGDAVRSLGSADILDRIDGEMRRDVSLTRAADLTEQAARVMLSDLDEWRLVNQQRELEYG